MGQLRLLVVDDHQLMLEAIRSALAGEDEIDVVGEARSGYEALVLARDAAPDIVLLDLRMPGMDGVQVLEELRKRFPSVRVVALSGSDDEELTREVLARGASAFVSKSVDPRDLAAVLRQVAEGTVTSNVIESGERRSERAAREAGLTERESEVLAGLAEGRSNKQIALQLRVSEQAVKYHLTNVYRKLSTSGRVEALRRANELGLVDTRAPLSL
ncbi:MAG TPA: response regulator transcription factor [Gaiellaceae bacterium]|nr:response regulator transcription factor [Gaiellaceae bacterium]